MSSENIIKRYPLDLTAKHPDNKISDELHVVDSRTRIFALKAGAFYADTVKITHHGEELLINEHFKFVRFVEAAAKRSRKNVAMFVFLTADIRGEVHIEYQCVGGEFQEIPESLIEMLESYKHDARGIHYQDLIDKPTLFEPVRHLHSIYDIYGLNPIADPLNQLVAIQRERIVKADSKLLIRLHSIEEKIKDVDFDKVNEKNIDKLATTLAEMKGIIDTIGDPNENHEEEQRYRNEVTEKLKTANSALEQHRNKLAELAEKDIQLTNALSESKTELGNRITELLDALNAFKALVETYRASPRELVSDIPGAKIVTTDTTGFTLTIPRDPKIAEHDQSLEQLNSDLNNVRNLPRATPDDIASLNAKHDELNKTVHDHGTRLDNHDIKLGEHTAELTKVNERVDETNQDLNAFKTATNQWQNEKAAEITDIKAKAETEKSERANETKALRDDLVNLQNVVENNKSAIENKLDEKIAAEHNEANNRINALNDDLNTAKNTLNNKIDTEKATLQGNIDKADNKLTELQSQVTQLAEHSAGSTSDLEQRIAATNNALDAYKVSNDAAVDVERKRIDALDKKVDDYKVANDKKVNDLTDAHTGTADKLRTLTADITPRMQSAEERIAAAEAASQANIAADKARDATINELKAKDTELAAKDAELVGSIQSVSNALNSAKSELEQSIATAKEEAGNANQALTEKVEANKQAADQSLAELEKKATALQTALDKTNENLSSGNNSANEALQALGSKVDELKAASEAKDNELNNVLGPLKTKVDNYVQENDAKQLAQDKEIDALKEKTDATNNALEAAKSDFTEKLNQAKQASGDKASLIDAEIAKLKEKDGHLEEGIQTLRNEFTEAKTALESKDAEIVASVSAEQQRATARENEIEAKITQSNSDRATEKQALENSINALKEKQASDKSALDEKITAANQAHDALKEQVESKTTADNEKFTALENKASTLSNQIAERDKAQASRDDALAAYKQDVAGKLTALEEKAGQGAGSHDTLKQRVDGIDTTVQSLGEKATAQAETLKAQAQTNAELKAKDAELAGLIETNKSEIAKNAGEITALKAKDTALEESITNTNSRIDDANSEIAKLKQSSSSGLDEAKKALNQRITTEAERTTALEQKAEETKAALASQDARITTNAETASKQAEKITALEERANAVNSKIDEKITAATTPLQQKIDDNAEKYEQLDNTVDTALQTIDSHSNHLTEHDTAIADLTKKVTANTEKNNAQDVRLTALEEKDKSHDASISAEHTKNEEQDGKLTTLQSGLESTNEKITAANAEIEKLKAASASGVSEAKKALDNRINEEAAKTAALDTRLGTAEGKLNAVTEKADNNANEIATAKNKITALEEKASAVSGKIDEKITAAVTPINEKVGQLETAQTALKSTVDTAVGNIQANTNKLATLEGDIGTVRDSANANQARLNTQANQITALQAKDTELEKAIGVEHDKNATQDEKLTALESAKEDYQTRIAALEEAKRAADAKAAEDEASLGKYATKKEVKLHVTNLSGAITNTKKELMEEISTGDATTLGASKAYTDEKFKTSTARIEAASQSITNNYNELKGLIDGQTGSQAAVNEKLTSVTDKANANEQAVAGLNTRVQQAEGKVSDLTSKVQANTDKNTEQDTKISTLEGNFTKLSNTLDSIKAVSGNVDALTAKIADATAAKEKAEANAGKIATLESSIASLGTDYILKSSRYRGWMTSQVIRAEENIKSLMAGKTGGLWVAMMPSEVNFHKHADETSRIAGFVVDQNNGMIDFNKGAGIRAADIGLRQEYWGHTTMRDIIDAMRDRLLIEKGGHGLPEMTYQQIDDRFNKIWPSLRANLPTPTSLEKDYRIIRNPVRSKLDYYQGYQIDAILLGKIRQMIHYPSLDTGVNYLNYGAMKLVNLVVQGWQEAASWRELARNQFMPITLPEGEREIKFKHAIKPNRPLWVSKEQLDIFKPGRYEITVTLSAKSFDKFVGDAFGFYSKDDSNWNRWCRDNNRVMPFPDVLVDDRENHYYRHKFFFDFTDDDLKHAPFHFVIDAGRLHANINKDTTLSHICVTEWRGPFINTYIPGERDNAEPTSSLSSNQAELIQAEVRRYVREQSQPQTNTLDISRFKVQPGAEDWSNVSTGENNTINVRGVVLQQFDGGETSVFAPSQVFQISEPQTWTVPATLVGKKAEIIVRAASKQDGDQITHSAVRRIFVTLPNAQINLLAGELASFGQYLTVNVNQDYPDALYPRTQVPASDVNRKQTAMITITV